MESGIMFQDTMSKWNIVTQLSGITDTMRTNILSTLRTSIETHGSSKAMEVCKNTKTWLDETYGEYWCVIVGAAGESSSYCSYFDNMFLAVEESGLKWRITVFKQAIA
ncbi:unnamed protein product [Rotaria magnacalcarata]|uniref:Dynein light chain n=1 Tax=Rotaria magnacalcarata TaxID=392030 RepID=A0A816XLH2_9BILA|nr:unnamed protein product [Rotaria magnacalcarata]